MTRLRQARLLVGPTARTTAWLSLAPAAALGIGVLSLDGPVVLEMRLAAIALCVAAAFMLDDAAADTIASSPTPLLFRRLLRVALVLPLFGTVWGVLLAYAGVASAGAITLELAAMLAVVLAAASVAAPFVPDGRGGVVAAPALLVFLAAAAVALPEPWTLFAAGTFDPRWEASHERWALVLVAAVLAFVYASLDPGHPRLIRLRASREPLAPAGTTDAA